MYPNPENPKETKKVGKKIAVVLSETIDPQISIELLAVIYEGLDVEPISFEETREVDEGLLVSKDPIEPLLINANSEIISPMIPIFDSEVFVLNYQKFYEK